MNEASRALEAIRHTELDAARRLEESRDRASQIVAEASARAGRLVEEGRERGRAKARSRRCRSVAEAEAEAEAVMARARIDAERLTGSVKAELSALVDLMVEAVLPADEEMGE